MMSRKTTKKPVAPAKRAAGKAARAQVILDGMLPFDEWAARLSPDQMAICALIGGSPSGFYAKFKAAVEAEAKSPTPTRIFAPVIRR